MHRTLHAYSLCAIGSGGIVAQTPDRHDGNQPVGGELISEHLQKVRTSMLVEGGLGVALGQLVRRGSASRGRLPHH